MKFYDLNSIIVAQKKPVALNRSTESFGIVPKSPEPYIKPTFEKEEFACEKPPVVLVSAVGATGKTTLARVLSNSTKLPLLDLSKHKAVGANTVTGLLTSTFLVQDLTSVFERIERGAFGMIVDGIDEGKSKTSEEAFEAFLDDIVRLCKGATGVSFVLLGRTRTQALEDCWLYLTMQGVETGLVTIRPFDIEQAREYIDKFNEGPQSAHPAKYCEVRDTILQRLGAAFTTDSKAGSQSFLNFIGYPPVLDAIVTLLQQEKNYYRLKLGLHDGEADGVEVALLHRIASYILQREREEKVVRNILADLIKEMPQENQREARRAVYADEEQSMRLVAHCLGKAVELRPIGEPTIDDTYENRLKSFLPEHPFITGHNPRFRNAVFEAFALSALILSSNEDAVQLALEYVDAHKHNYHLLYFLDRMAESGQVPANALRVIIGSALEFRSRTAYVEVIIGDVNIEDWTADSDQVVPVEIELTTGSGEGQWKRFTFESKAKSEDSIHLGDRFSSTYVFLPCGVVISGAQQIEVTAPVAVFAARVDLRSPELVVRAPSSNPDEKMALFAAESLGSSVSRIVTNGTDLVLAVTDRSEIAYPAIQYVENMPGLPRDGALAEKHRRLRRILVLFRSHSRGALARCAVKIEDERVLKNALGRAILESLVRDQIVVREGAFYYLQPENVDKYLGVSWVDLRKGATSEKLEQYLRSIDYAAGV